MTRIPCLILVYFDFPTIRATLDSLLPCRDRLDFIVIENSSEFTESHIRPYIHSLVEAGDVSTYFLFERNISNNAWECVLDSGEVSLEESEYLLITDGDILVDGDAWLSEEIEILRCNPDVAACGLSFSLDNLPIDLYPEAAKWAEGGAERPMYYDGSTGNHFLLVRTEHVRGFLDYLKTHGVRALDFEFARYIREVANKKWVRTKKNTGKHLTWDLYRDPEHPYTKAKLWQSYERIWAHHRYSSFLVYRRGSMVRRTPIRKIIRGRVAGAKAWLLSRVRGTPAKYKEWDWETIRASRRKP